MSNPIEAAGGKVHGLEAPSPWVTRWAHLLPAGARALDVASGAGRHSHYLAARGCQVTALDRDGAALAHLQGVESIQTIQADIENAPWPLARQTFDAIIVTNYLWRALLPTLVASLAPSGVLIYETFATGNETVGKPSRPDFLLQTGELLRVCEGLRVVAFEDGFLPSPARFVQRIVAIRPALMPQAHETQGQSASAPPLRYPLGPTGPG